MTGTNLAVKPYIVSGIEWTLEEQFHFGVEQARLLERTIGSAHLLPIKGAVIPFASDIWDFRPLFHLRSDEALCFSFKSIPEGFVVSAKYFVLMTLLNSDMKISSVSRRFQDLKRFMKTVFVNGVHLPSQLTTKDIRAYLDQYNEKHALQTASMAKIAIKMYCTFLNVNYSYEHKIDLKLFDSYDWMTSALHQMRGCSKIPNIPENYYKQLLPLLIRVKNDRTARYDDRAVACVYIILSQTGLRISEIHALMRSSLQKIEVKGVDRAYYLNVNEFKPAPKHQEAISFRTYANELTVDAFKTLCKLSAERMEETRSEFVYLPRCKNLPAPVRTSALKFREMLSRYAPFAVFAKDEPIPYENLIVSTYRSSSGSERRIVYPSSKQFRVHVCTELHYTFHVPLLFIQRCMGHLSSEMQGYYVRPKNMASEEAETRQKLLVDVIRKNVTLLGGKGKEITEQIDRFIRDGNFNVENDIDSLLAFLDGKVAIRVKKSGFCVKASEYRECSRDAKTNEIFCAYDICPNLCHVYYMAADSYEDFKLLQKTFEENHRNGFELQASRELKKLKAVCSQRLIPEMEDMKKKIQLRGLSAVLMDYPRLEPIIQNYDEIMEEVEIWKMKKY